MKPVLRLLGHAYLQCILYSLMCLSLIYERNFVAAALAILVVALFGGLKRSSDLVRNQAMLIEEQHAVLHDQQKTISRNREALNAAAEVLQNLDSSKMKK